MEIKNIIFDVGKVLVSYEPDEMLVRLGFDRETRDAVNAAVFENELWELSDQGLFTPEEILAKAKANAPGYEAAVEKAWEHVGDSIEILPHAVEWVSDLKARGYHLYILSNYSEHTMELTKQKMAFLPYMDGALFSYTCKLAKPDEKIYEYLLNKFRLNASECIFIDDRMVNVEGARACGIQAILFEDYESARKELDALLG